MILCYNHEQRCENMNTLKQIVVDVNNNPVAIQTPRVD